MENKEESKNILVVLKDGSVHKFGGVKVEDNAFYDHFGGMYSVTSQSNETYIFPMDSISYIRKWSPAAEKHGQIYSCGLSVISNPSPDDYCSKAERNEEEEEKDIINEAYLIANSIDAVRGFAYRNGHIRESEELDSSRMMILELIDYIKKKEE